MSYDNFFGSLGKNPEIYRNAWQTLAQKSDNEGKAFFDVVSRYLRAHPEEKPAVKKQLLHFIKTVTENELAALSTVKNPGYRCQSEKEAKNKTHKEKIYAALLMCKFYDDRAPLSGLMSAPLPYNVQETLFAKTDDKFSKFSLTEMAKCDSLSIYELNAMLIMYISLNPSDKRMTQALQIAKQTKQPQTKENRISLLRTIAGHTSNPKICEKTLSALMQLGNDDWAFLNNRHAQSLELDLKCAVIKEEKNLKYTDRNRIEENLRNRCFIENYLNQKHPDLPFEQQLLKEAAAVAGSGDETKKQEFFAVLLSEGENRLSEIDEQVMAYLVDNFTQENLDAVNHMRGLYGIKVSLLYGEPTDTNINTVKRMQFDNMVRGIDDAEYFNLLHSREFLEFEPDEDREFAFRDYLDLDEKSPAFQALEKYGYENFKCLAVDSFIKHHVPPQTAVAFNLKDIHELIVQDNEYEREPYDYEDGDVGSCKDWFFLSELDADNNIEDARSIYWAEMVKNKSLVKAISDDLKEHNICDSDIEELWRKVSYGTPNAGRKRRGSGFSFQLHHNRALKDGGENTPDNFVTTVKYTADPWDNGSQPDFCSHDFLHRQDSPLIKLYENPDARTPQDKIATTEPVTPNARRVRIVNELISPDPWHRVLYYGGPRQSGCYRGILRNMTNIPKQTKKQVARTRKRVKKNIDLPCEIIKTCIKRGMAD